MTIIFQLQIGNNRFQNEIYQIQIENSIFKISGGIKHLLEDLLLTSLTLPPIAHNHHSPLNSLIILIFILSNFEK